MLKDFLPAPQGPRTAFAVLGGLGRIGLAANGEEAHTLRSQSLFVQDSERRAQSWMKSADHLSPPEMASGLLR